MIPSIGTDATLILRDCLPSFFKNMTRLSFRLVSLLVELDLLRCMIPHIIAVDGFKLDFGAIQMDK